MVEETAAMLTQSPGGTSQLFWKDGRFSEADASEVEQLRSPSGWKSMVELVENDVGRSLVLLGRLRPLSDEELEASTAEKKDT